MTLPRYNFAALPDELAELLRSKYERLGYLGEFYQVAAAHPEALAGFVKFTESLKRALDHDLTEVIALTIATQTDNDYERAQHERLSISRGLSGGWIRAVERCDPDSGDELDQRQRTVQRLVLSMLRSAGRTAPPFVADLERLLPPADVVAVLLTACRYAGHAAVVNALALTAPVMGLDAADSESTHPSEKRARA